MPRPTKAKFINETKNETIEKKSEHPYALRLDMSATQIRATVAAFKKYGLTCQVVPAGAKDKLHVSFTSLSSLLAAQSQAKELGYKATIVQTSIPTLHGFTGDMSSLPFASPKTELMYVQHEDQVAQACELLEKQAKESHNILGLDCEWRPEFTKGQVNPIDVIQISSNKTTVVFHMTFLRKNNKSAMVQPLKDLLLNQEIKKIVLDVHDIRKLHTQYTIDIPHINLQQMPIIHRFKNKGLAGMVATMYKERLSKSQTMSNWSKVLTPVQLKYAALDAEMTYNLYFSIKDLPLDP